MSWSFYFIGSPDKAVAKLEAWTTDNHQGLMVKDMLLEQIKSGKQMHGNCLKIDAHGHSSQDSSYGPFKVELTTLQVEYDEQPVKLQNVYVPVSSDSPFLKEDGTPATEEDLEKIEVPKKPAKPAKES